MLLRQALFPLQAMGPAGTARFLPGRQSTGGVYKEARMFSNGERKPKLAWEDRSILYRFFGFFGHMIFDFKEMKIRTSFLLAVSQVWIMCVVTYVVIYILHAPVVRSEIVGQVILALIPAIFQLAIHTWGIYLGKGQAQPGTPSAPDAEGPQGKPAKVPSTPVSGR